MKTTALEMGTQHGSRYLFAALVVALLFTPSSAFWGSATEKKEEEKEEFVPQSDEVPVEYGVDVSFPMHYSTVSDNYAWLPHNIDPENNPTPDRYKDMVVQPLGDRQKFYDDYVQGCKDHFFARGSRCIANERDRVAMSLRQPQSMTNYTDVGFKKIRAPEKVFKLIKQFWEKNHDKQKPENWGVGNTYTNNWDVPTYMVSVEDSTLRGGGSSLKQQIWNAAKETISEWTQEELTQCSLYGIRVYKEGAVLATHVDRLPLVSSAIINVASDVDEPWPLEVYGHDGKATNVTMEPGDMVLYESHSVLHGRPFPMKGRFVANVFIHFEPIGHSLRHNAKMDAKHDVDKKYKEATARGLGGHESDHTDGLPPYIIPGTPEETHWRRSHPQNRRSKQDPFATGSTSVHLAAQKGDLDTVKKLVENDKSLIHKADENGWTPLHEGARAGNKEIVKYLYDKGADLNARTHQGAGGSPLWWTKKELGEDHEMVSFLEELGAIDAGPEL